MALAAKASLTVEDFFALPDLEERCLELDEGELIEMTRPSPRHAAVCMQLSAVLNEWVSKRKLGRVFGSELAFTLNVARAIVRAPDCAVLLGDAASMDLDRRIAGGPTIAIEVISPSETVGQIKRKRNQYLAAGSREVWLIYPADRSVEVYTDGGIREYTSPGIIRTELLPGLEISLESIFPK